MNVQLQDYLTKKVVNIAEGVVLTEKLSHLIFSALQNYFSEFLLRSYQMIFLLVQVYMVFNQKCTSITEWKFHDFSVTQILRETNFGEPRSSKTAAFAIF